AARRRFRIEPGELAVAAVAGMMVDVDDERSIEPRDPRAIEIAAFEDNRGIEVSLDPIGHDDLGDAGKRHQRPWRRVLVHHTYALAERAQRVRERELGADRVAVRTGVGR